jgi:hypothetical protein
LGVAADRIQFSLEKKDYFLECHQYLANCKKEKNDWEGAVTNLKEVCSLSQDSSDSVLELGIVEVNK